MTLDILTIQTGGVGQSHVMVNFALHLAPFGWRSRCGLRVVNANKNMVLSNRLPKTYRTISFSKDPSAASRSKVQGRMTLHSASLDHEISLLLVEEVVNGLQR